MNLNKLFKLACLASVTWGLSSCATYSVSGTIGMKNLSGNATIQDELLVAANEDGMNVAYDLHNGRAVINNAGEKTLLIDKAASYYVGNDGISKSMFNNSVTTVSSSNTSGASVNLGSVAGALGVGGALGSLASGINVGGANTTGTQTQIFEQQYIVIPPYTSQTLDLPREFEYQIVIKKSQLPDEQHSLESTPLHSTYIISYANEEDKQFKPERDAFYLSEIKTLTGRDKYFPDANNKFNFNKKSKSGAWWLTSAGVAMTAISACCIATALNPDEDSTGYAVAGGLLAGCGIGMTTAGIMFLCTPITLKFNL